MERWPGSEMMSVLRDSEEQQVVLFEYFLSPQQTERIIVVTKRCCHAKISFIGLLDDWSLEIIRELKQSEEELAKTVIITIWLTV